MEESKLSSNYLWALSWCIQFVVHFIGTSFYNVCFAFAHTQLMWQSATIYLYTISRSDFSKNINKIDKMMSIVSWFIAHSARSHHIGVIGDFPFAYTTRSESKWNRNLLALKQKLFQHATLELISWGWSILSRIMISSAYVISTAILVEMHIQTADEAGDRNRSAKSSQTNVRRMEVGKTARAPDLGVNSILCNARMRIQLYWRIDCGRMAW